MVLKACSRWSFPLSEEEIEGRIDGIVEGAFQLARIRALPNVSSELHLKVATFCFVAPGIGILVPYARVAFAFLWLDGTPLSLDWDFYPPEADGRDFYSSVELAVDGALRAYIRANFAADM